MLASMSAPARLNIVCPACPPQQIIEITAEASEARCPVCRRYYRVVTRQLKSVHSTRLGSERTRYDITTIEGPDRTRPRHFEALPTTRLVPNYWITLVYRGPRLLGIADQTTSFWHPQPIFALTHKPLRRLLFMLSVVCLLLAAVQLQRLLPALRAVGSHSSGQVALVAALVFALAPAFLWVLQTGWNQRRSKLPFPTREWSE
jgi:hypothetical protein